MTKNSRSTSWRKNSKIPPPNQGERPICSHPGCIRERAIINTTKSGYAIWRNVCDKHHNERTAAKYNLNNIAEITAQRNGFSTPTKYRNSFHPYRKYRKDYCENIDGRLGYNCTSTIVDECQLDVDHIDGDPRNNDEGNLQTLCKCCHSYKTIKNKDSSTPGRKSYGLVKSRSEFVAEMC